MDLLQQSGYGDGDTDEGSTTTSSSSSRVDETTGVSDSASPGRKRKRGHGDGGHAGQRDAQFIRSVPHTPGNWASHVFCPLVDTHPSSASVCKASRYEGINRAAGRRLCNVARGIIAKFTDVLKDRQKERGGMTSGLVVVSHLPAGNYDADDSSSTSSSDEDDDANRCDERERHDKKRKSNGKDMAVTEEAKNVTTVCEGNRDDSSSIPLHISLSRPFYLQEQSIASFVDHLTKALSIFAPIPITFNPNQPPQVLVNDERTRTFLTIPALSSVHQQQQQKSSDIIKLIRAVDAVMERFGQPTYYDHPRIHVSIASVPCDAGDMLAGLYRMPRQNGVGTNASNGGNKTKGGVVDDAGMIEATPQKQTPQEQNITFMVDRISCTFGGAKNHFVFLSG
mmetsp:Transcript_5595/g.11818  ORF Transcript_5595/g.11818 Transcript_5595/m.11818 type:complete len:395 (-) Transcript_5595:151-1335(-)